MATALCEDETEDLVTCHVCLCEYNPDSRKPKFLPCSHTICLQCLKEIHKNSSVTCPFCRKVSAHSGDVSSLPNNPYALHMLKLTSKNADPPPKAVVTTSTLTSTIREFEALLLLKEELGELKKQGEAKLKQATRLRKKIKDHLELLTNQLDEERKTLEYLKKENAENLTKIGDKLQESQSSRVKAEKDPSPLSDLAALVSDSQPGDTVATLQEKMKQKVFEAAEDLSRAEELAYQLFDRNVNQIKVTINGKSIPVGDKPGLFSFIAYDMLDMLEMQEAANELAASGLINLDDPDKAPGPSMSSEHDLIDLDDENEVQEAIPPSPARSNGSPKILVMTIRRSGAVDFHGEVHIQLKPDFAPSFFQKLGNFCSRSPKQFSNAIAKAIPGIFALIPMSNPDFRPRTSELSHAATARAEQARQNADVGITMVANSSPGLVMGWSLLFPLNFFTARESLKHVKPLPPAALMGHVKKGMNVLVSLTRMTKQQLQNDLTLTLEARF